MNRSRARPLLFALAAVLAAPSFVAAQLISVVPRLNTAASAPTVSAAAVALSAGPLLAPLPTTIALIPAAPAAAVAAPKAATPAARVTALSAALDRRLEAARDLSKTGSEASAGVGRDIINQVLAQNDAPASGDAVPAAQPPAYGLLKTLGLREKILLGGGIPLNPDGTPRPVETPIRFSAFDNDDNLVYLPTKIYLRKKTTHEEVALTTGEFAEVRPDIGKSGPYADYELFGLDQPNSGSYRNFRDVDDPEIFSKDIAAALKSPMGSWRGPSWFAFATAMSDPKTAPWISIVTSRGHRPASVVKGFGRLKDLGNLKGTLREELVFGASSPELARLFPKDLGTPERKVEVLMELLDLVESVPLVDAAKHHSFGFSDDDRDMIDRVAARLSREQEIGGRWPHVKISLFSTGPKNESIRVLEAPRKPKP